MNIRAFMLTVAAMTGAALTLQIPVAQAIPSFARQTNLACNVCHTIFPELTPFGRLFKLNGYTMTGGAQIESGGGGAQTILKLNEIPPFSAMIQTSFARTDKTVPNTQNNDVEFPQQLSFFFAGAITPYLGIFMQITYEPESGHFNWDNTDVRFARSTTLSSKKLIYGITLNNNPTVQDVWNSSPAWGFPYAFSDVSPTPMAGTLIDGRLAQVVAGLGGYALWNDFVYAEADVYRSSPQGAPDPSDITSTDTIRRVAPYWRLAFQHQWAQQYLEAGTYGLTVRQYPTGISGATDRYTDLAADLQYERKLGDDLIVAHGTYIHEKQDLDATFALQGSANPTNNLQTVRVDGSYLLEGRYGATLAFFTTWGDRDTGLYSAAPISGSRTGSPNSNGVTLELQYLPWLNTKLAVQYTAYNKFNGAKDNYDGFGRDASENNTLYFLLWYSF